MTPAMVFWSAACTFTTSARPLLDHPNFCRA
jgi:hypothetical protein